MAGMWLTAHHRDEGIEKCDFRFDVISILLDEDGGAAELRHIKDAFR